MDVQREEPAAFFNNKFNNGDWVIVFIDRKPCVWQIETVDAMQGGYQIVTLIGGQSNWFSASGLPIRFCKEDVVMASITEPTLANSRGFFKLISNDFHKLKSFNDTIF